MSHPRQRVPGHPSRASRSWWRRFGALRFKALRLDGRLKLATGRRTHDPQLETEGTREQRTADLGARKAAKRCEEVR
jgi:hypothetical protein